MPRSTDDCKNFLVDFFKRNPQIMRALFGDINPIEQQFVITKKNWKRLWKCDATKCGYNVGDHYLIYKDGMPVNKYAEGQEHRPATDYVIARGFECEPSDGAIAYIVLEAADGTLTLGDYIGD